MKGDTESDVNTVRFNFPEIVEYKGEPMYVGKSQGSVVAEASLELHGRLPLYQI